MADGDPSRELAEAVRAIRERVRARYPTGDAAGIPLADLMPAVHARDAAEAKAGAIGTVNPRRPGPVSSLIQAAKRLIARALDWHVREQVEFNRAVMQCVESLIEAHNQSNRALVELASRTAELKDISSHWIAWRAEWEHKLSVNEIQFLRSVADLQTAFQQRVSLMESAQRDLIRTQHQDFTGALERATLDIQKKLWDDLRQVRGEYERLIQYELRLVRQRAAATPALTPAPAAPSAPQAAPQLDWLAFAGRFRGSEDYVRESHRFYVPFFERCKSVLDIGCGRGEFLALLRAASVPARGIDLSAECVALCRAQGLDVIQADLFDYLPSTAPGSLDGLFASQLIEHLPPERLPGFIRMAADALAPGGVIALETPNPECLAIFATHFYLDPTHTRPVPSKLLTFYLEESSFGQIEVLGRASALNSFPGLAEAPPALRDAFFGFLDYALIARKL